MPNIRSSWTNHILHTTAFVARTKAKLETAHAFAAIGLVLALIAAEAWLAFISLPLYLVTRQVGTGKKDVHAYGVRRVLTLSILSVIGIIWILKLAIILFLTFSTNPRTAFQVEHTGTREETIAAITVEIPRAAVDARMPAPTITAVAGTEGSIAIIGHARPQETIVATLVRAGDATTARPHLYADTADDTGTFTIREDAGIFSLPTGPYSVQVVAYDGAAGMKSAPSASVQLEVATHPVRQFLGFADHLLNLLAIVFIAVGVLATVLTI